jgi:hypothetical protein
MIKLRPEDFRRTEVQAGAAAGAALLVALVMGWLNGRAHPATLHAQDEEQWSIPQVRESSAARDQAVLSSRKLWNGYYATGSSQGGGQSAPAKWRFAGTVVRGQERFALIAGESGGKLQYLKIGDKLPDGSSLVDISPDTLVSDGGSGTPEERHSYHLFTPTGGAGAGAGGAAGAGNNNTSGIKKN